jgi:hypothetical protein
MSTKGHLGIRERVAKFQRLRMEYENAMLNENLDSYDGLLEAVKYVLVEVGYPAHIHDEKVASK